MEPARRGATYGDLLDLPETMIGEIIDGDLYASPRPALPHANAASGITGSLRAPFHGGPAGGQPGGWWILFEPELHLGRDVLVADVAGWRRERLAQLPDAPFLDQAPDWACEVVSPSSGSIDRVAKMRIYARESVGHVWLVEPLQRTLEVFRLESGRWMVAGSHSGATIVRAEPFDAIEIDLRPWWT
jgi:Uma2 family endonuclease